MITLSNSMMFRGGVTRPTIGFERTEITVERRDDKGELDIRFALGASGGTTAVLLRIDKDDVDTLELMIKRMKQKRIAALIAKIEGD